MQRDCFSIHDDDIANRIIVKNDLVFAFPSNRPIRPGHILVCPIRHVSTISGLYENELLAICALAENIKHALQKSVGAEGFHVAYNEGAIANQTVNHFHLHIVPRKEGDQGLTAQEPRKFLYRSGDREISFQRLRNC